MNMQLPLPLLLYPTRPSKFQILDIQRTKGYSIAMKSSCGRLGVYVCVRVRVCLVCAFLRARASTELSLVAQVSRIARPAP